MQEVWSLLNLVAGWMQQFIVGLSRWLQEAFTLTFEWLTQTAAVIFGRIEETLRATRDMMAKIAQAVESALTGVLTTVTETVNRIWEQISEATYETIEKIGNFVSNMSARVFAAIEGIVGQVTNVISNIAGSIERLIQAIILRAQQAIELLSSGIREEIKVTMETANRAFDAVQEKIQEGIDILLSSAGSLVEGIGEKLGDIREGFKEAALSLAETVTGVSEDILSPMKATLATMLEAVSINSDPRELPRLTEKLKEMMAFRPKTTDEFIDLWWGRFEDVHKGSIWTSLGFTLINIIGLVMLAMSLGSVQASILLQDFQEQFPHQILSPADATQAWRRGLLDTEQAVAMMKRQGYSEDLSQTILYLSDIMPPEMDLFQMFHRGLIDEGELRNALFEKGIKDEMQSPLIQASYVLPPISDLITMSVREVFTPAVAERFGQFEDFPQDFAREAAKQGLTDEWAKRYWAAHWALPSPQQGFEMLHRGVIEVEDLNLLLRALDVMPFWRDKLTAIAYSPYTRVDVRRMHKVGVLTDEQVYRAYLDLGYDPEKAKNLTDFTKKLNAPDVADDPKTLEDLTRANIVGLYEDGILERDRALALLIGNNYSPEAAELYLHQADVNAQRKERNETIQQVIDLSKAGIYTFEESQDILQKLGLEQKEVDRATTTLLRVQQTRTKLPSRTEAERMLKADAIDMDDYKDILERLGYSKKWREAYIKLYEGSENGD